MSSVVRHRSDIDGLRAIGAVGVILAHAGVPGCAGGFLSVDIFFVLSGYLITSNIAGRLAQGRFALLDFYARRTRRTLPALYLVALCSLVAGAVLFLPGEFDAMARSLVATILLLSNVYFMRQSGYFDHDAMSKPLLHTWSLGVEEQFYLLSPLIPFALAKIPKPALRPVLFTTIAALFALCVAWRASSPTGAFFLMPTRLWEFLAGAAVAADTIPKLRGRFGAEAVAALALLGFLISLTCFGESVPHPGWPTVLPVLATVLLLDIGKTHETVAARILGSRVPVFLGLISYSLYLWHWPMLVYARYVGLDPTSAPVLTAGGVLLLALSYLSWRFVEQPFREGGNPLRLHARAILASGAAVLGCVSVGIVLTHGVPERFDATVSRVASYYDYAVQRPYREGKCFITSKYGDMAYFDHAACLHESATRKNYLILGDSHAAQLWTGFKTVFTNANVMQATASGCKPVLDASGQHYCTALMKEVLRRFLPHHPVDAVFLSAAWNAADAGHLAETVTYLKRYAAKVVVLGPIPSHTMPLPTLLARSILEDNKQLLVDEQSTYPFEVDRLFKGVVPAKNYVSLTDALCPDGVCKVYARDNVPLQFDTDHLTSEGSVRLAELLSRETVLADPPQQ